MAGPLGVSSSHAPMVNSAISLHTTHHTLSEFGALQQIAAPAKFLDLGGGQGA